jgi:hypothetical protein
MMFRRLMDVEKEVSMTLLPDEEKKEIQRLWKLDGYKGPTVSVIEREQKVRARLRGM